MTEEKEKLLVKKYPSLFKDYHGDPMKTCMTWGIEHDDGWFDIIDSMCAKLLTVPNGDDLYFGQIKEKYGTLRVYMENMTDTNITEVYKIISAAEHKSEFICERCGKINNTGVKGHSWVVGYCDTCYKEYTDGKQ